MTEQSQGSGVRHIEHPGASPQVLIIGTLDTKSVEIAAVSAEVEACGAQVVLLDTSGRAHPKLSSEELGCGRTTLGRDDVAHAAGTSSEAVADLPRGEAVAALRSGVRALTLGLQDSGRIQAVLCIGGAGAYIAKDAFGALPLGFPKLIVSPLASGKRVFEPYTGTRDVATLHSVADIVGINPITMKIFRMAAGYVVGAAKAAMSADDVRPRPAVAISMNGNTTDALIFAKDVLEDRGYSVVAFHANGVGGRALEEFAGSGEAVAVLDYTTTELNGHEIGGLMDAGAERMQTAGAVGIPQVLVPGCLDFITCGPAEEAQEQFPGRPIFAHNPELTLVRLTQDEMSQMGRTFAAKANSASGPVVVCVPTEGLSVSDAPGRVFWDPEADAAFVTALRGSLRPEIPLHLLPFHINDPEFVDMVLEELLALLPAARTAASRQPTPTPSPVS
ncbi:Tm-1-like ATP-binding domain-containing protein [Janibacter melonis]|uniref:Tm-1-like ATP-binding domain-containing protein n=1 Tax=Janibacter melonis TaxID=262209 RepID=UPI00174D9764|nr:Tm-1-like ATP-binding domain-containing protein [Janibacter melonis]